MFSRYFQEQLAENIEKIMTFKYTYRASFLDVMPFAISPEMFQRMNSKLLDDVEFVKV